ATSSWRSRSGSTPRDASPYPPARVLEPGWQWQRLRATKCVDVAAAITADGVLHAQQLAIGSGTPTAMRPDPVQTAVAEVVLDNYPVRPAAAQLTALLEALI